jgi:adenosylcobyric acid synthase
VSLLEPGIRMMEQRVEKPCLGVVPYLQSLMLEEEDSLGLPTATHAQWSIDELANRSPDRPLRIAVVALPSFSNFTDFDSLRAEATVSLLFCRTADAIAQADVVILPGSKQTVDDLIWMRKTTMDIAVQRHSRTGLVVGICGGMQMLGETITDPLGMEREGSTIGLGLLPIQTIMRADKVTRNVTGEMSGEILFGRSVTDRRVSGYEIHIGETIYRSEATHFASLSNSSDLADVDGCISVDTRIFGTYLHGLFDEDGFRHEFIRAARAFHSLNMPKKLLQWKRLREDSLNRLAHEVEDALHMETIFGWVGLPYESSFSIPADAEHGQREDVEG